MTSKSIPALLLDTYQQRTTVLTNLLKIVARDGTVLGLTNAEEDIVYDDGAGEVTYSAPIGMDSYAMQVSADLSVDNSEIDILLADSGMFTDEQIAAGVLDYGEYVVYRVNRLDLSQGHEGPVDRGTIGITKNVDGVAGIIELRSLQQQAKQTYGPLYSITCRAEFGSGGGGECLFRGQCGFDAESLWQNHSVASVGAETDRIFTADSTPAVNGPNGALTFAPGLVQWLTGDNTGLTSEVEAMNGAEITLRFGTLFTIQASDTFKIRPDCDKTWETCRDDYDNQNNFRGEPKIPLADEGSQSIPSSAPIPQPVPSIPPPDTDPPDDPTEPPPVPPPPSPDTNIVNPGFESGDTGWTEGAGWQINRKKPRSGSYGAEYNGIYSAPILQTTHFAVTPGTSITASCYVLRGTLPQLTASVILRWYDSANIEIAESAGNIISSGSGWQKSTVTANAPALTAFVSVGAKAYDGDYRASIYVDDFTWNY